MRPLPGQYVRIFLTQATQPNPPQGYTFMIKTAKSLLLSAAALVASSTAIADGHSDSVIEKILREGEIRVGMSTFVPWVMRSKDGEYIGFEVDVAREVAKDMGVELVIVPTQWDGIIPALLAGKFDVIIGGMSITPERNLKVNFSTPYAQSGLLIVANRKEIEDITGDDEDELDFEDFDDEDVVFAMRRGVTAIDAVKEQFPEAGTRLFDEEATAIQEVVNGNATAWVSASPSAAVAVSDHGSKLFLPFIETFDNSNEGFALRKGDPDALNFFNNWILTKHESGWLEERHTYWFKTRDWAGMVAQDQ